VVKYIEFASVTKFHRIEPREDLLGAPCLRPYANTVSYLYETSSLEEKLTQALSREMESVYKEINRQCKN